MNQKTCSITVTTTDNKEIIVKCTSTYLEEVKIILDKLRPFMQGDVTAGTIRLWKLGKSNHQILPSQDLIDKLIDILKHNTGNGALDIVWDDMIDLQVEYLPDTVSKFIFLGTNLIIRIANIKSIVLQEEEQN